MDKKPDKIVDLSDLQISKKPPIEKYKIAKLGNYGIKKEYSFETFDELEKWAANELEEYKKKNKVKDEAKDKSFIEYKFQIDMLVYNALNKID